MKKVFCFLLSLLCLQIAYSQNDRFINANELLGKNIYVTSGNIQPSTYVMIDGKLKLAQKDKKHYYNISSRSYNVDSELYTYKKDDYVVLKGGSDIFFLKVNDNPIFLTMMRNESYWTNYIGSLNEEYPFMDIEKGREYHGRSSYVVYDKLSKLTWTGFKWVSDNIVLYASEVDKKGNTQKSFSLTPMVFNDIKGEVFVRKDDIQRYVNAYEQRLAKEKREQDRRDSIYNCKLRLATAKKDMTFGDEESTTYVSDGDTIAIYVYKDSIDRFVGRFRYENLRFEEDDIKFIDEKFERKSGSYSYEYSDIP